MARRKHEALLSSFGIAARDTASLAVRDVHPFYHMPPVDMDYPGGKFMPPYHLLLTCERLMLDQSTFGALLEHRRPPEYDHVAEVMSALHSEGLLDLVDYRSVLDEQRRLIEEMIVNDLMAFPAWAAAFEESQGIWEAFARLTPSARQCRQHPPRELPRATPTLHGMAH